LLSTSQRQNDLRDQIHREFVNRPFQFNKRGELFVSALSYHPVTTSISTLLRMNSPELIMLSIPPGKLTSSRMLVPVPILISRIGNSTTINLQRHHRMNFPRATLTRLPANFV
jgi:hypothetical protein